MPKKTPLYALAMILIIAGVFVFHSLFSRKMEKMERRRAVHSIAALIPLSPALTHHEIIDRVQDFINTNSAHKIDDEFHALWKDPAAHLGAMKDYVTGARAGLPPMECSTRSALMRNILKSIGFQVRDIDIFNIDANLNAHSFMEVWNPQTSHWESYDPDYHIFWINAATGVRVSFIKTLLAPDQHIPCNAKECGWHIKSREDIKAAGLQYFRSIASIIDRDRSQRYSLFAPHTPEGKIYEMSGQSGTFCAFWKKHCRNGFHPAATYRDGVLAQF